MKVRLPRPGPPPDAKLDEAAGYWFARLQSPHATAEDWRRFEVWRDQSPENAAAYDRLDAFWQAAADIEDAQEIQELREAVHSQRPARRFRFSAAVAASLIAAIVGAGWLSNHGNLQMLVTEPQAWFASGPDHGRFATAVGERSTIKLHDGSVLTLDTNSEVNVDYAAAQRTIYLIHGQVMFEVAHDKTRPFTVQAGDRRVIATGTAFSVRLDEAAVSVALVEGNVVVEQLPDGKSGVPKAETTLQPGERLVAKAGAPSSVTTTDIERVTSWRSGKVVFLDTPLADAVKELNRYSTDKILLADDAFAALRVNGVFRTGQPLDFARAVASVYPVTIDQEHPGQIRITTAAAR
jgi:transmembrane sensor